MRVVDWGQFGVLGLLLKTGTRDPPYKQGLTGVGRWKEAGASNQYFTLPHLSYWTPLGVRSDYWDWSESEWNPIGVRVES